jgi:hypothetical protein
VTSQGQAAGTGPAAGIKEGTSVIVPVGARRSAPGQAVARARCVPDRAVNDGNPRVPTVTGKETLPGLTQFVGLRSAAFQAGHAGSIPVARSTAPAQVRDMII